MMTTRARFHRPLPEVVRAWAMSLDDGVYGERRRAPRARQTAEQAEQMVPSGHIYYCYSTCCGPIAASTLARSMVGTSYYVYTVRPRIMYMYVV